MTKQTSKPLTPDQRERMCSRRRELRQISSQRRRELLDEYYAAPDDALLTELHIAADHQVSRALVQSNRLSGKGPPYLKTKSGAVRYRKSDNERHKAESMRQHRSTVEYADSAAQESK